MTKRITANFYTRGKFGNRLRETLDTKNCTLWDDIRPKLLPKIFLKTTLSSKVGQSGI